jgi:NAD(P)-dependent dehydrogenase (short-subunit alcohol dehydrogenase family)
MPENRQESSLLSGKHVLVFGASGGLGQASAVRLARQGATLTLVARSSRGLESIAEGLRSDGADVCIETGDVTDQQRVAHIVEQAAARHHLWGSLNAAGTNRTGATVDYAMADFEAVVHSSVHGAFVVAQAVGRELIRAGNGGRLVTMSSQMGSVGYPGRAAYCASKHAVNGLTKALAVEWATERITVNAVAPTFVETPMTANMFRDKAFRNDVHRRLPIGRLGLADEVAACVSFLMSEDSSLVTGHILAADGGWTAW